MMPRYEATVPEGDCGFTPIVQGDWKVEIYHSKDTGYVGFRRYHQHGKRWYSVVSYSGSYDSKEDYKWENKWKCGHCQEHTPEEMEGYINLARWSINDS